MKKVLIIANLFHASPRIPGIAMHLKEFGWEPVIIAPSLKEDPKNLLGFPRDFTEKIRIIETDYSGDIFSFFRKILVFFGFKKEKSILGQVKRKAGAKKQLSLIDRIFRFYAALFAYPDEEKKWKNIAFKAAEDILSREKFDAIISSSSPVTAHIVAKKIKEKYGIFWIADFRDLWTQNHDYSHPFIRKIFETRLEKRTLKLADVLITVSEPLARDLKSLHKGKETFCVTNGFFPEELNFPPMPLDKKFLITYAGNIYAGKQDPKDFFLALNQLIEEKIIDRNNVRVRFFCGITPWLDKEINDLNLRDIVKVCEKVKRSEAVKKQNESQILLLIYWGDKSQKGWQSLKIFGYLAAQRPILVINGAGEDVVEETIKKTRSGAYARDIFQIKECLKKFYNEYQNTGKVLYSGDMEEINKYNYRQKAREFAYIIEKRLKI